MHQTRHKPRAANQNEQIRLTEQMTVWPEAASTSTASRPLSCVTVTGHIVWQRSLTTGFRDSQEPCMLGKVVSCHFLPYLYRFLLTQTSFTYLFLFIFKTALKGKKNQWNFSCQHCVAGDEKSFRTADSMERFEHPPAIQPGHLAGLSHAWHRWSACHWQIAASKVMRVVEWTGTPLRRLTACVPPLAVKLLIH